MPTGTANLGRISGPLLKENLTRTSDLAFETDLLYIGHTNNKIGIRTDAPSKELTVTGTTKIPSELTVTTGAHIGNMLWDQDGIRSLVGPKTISTGAGGALTYKELRTEHLYFTNSTIGAYNTNSNIDIYPGPGTGKFIIPSDLKSYGNIHSTADITFDGSVFIGGDSDEDTIKFEGDITSNLMPDQSVTYDVGANAKRWGYFHVKSMPDLNNITIDNFISLNGVAVNLGITNKWYVTTDGTNSLSGTHPNFAFGTIKHTLSTIEESTAGPHEVHVFPGTYEEIFPLEIPENTTIKGVGQGAVIIKTTAGTQSQFAFLLNDSCSVQNVTITGSLGGFKFANNATIVNKSPYLADIKLKLEDSTAYGFSLNGNVTDTNSEDGIILKNVSIKLNDSNSVGIYTTGTGVKLEAIECIIEGPADKGVSNTGGEIKIQGSIFRNLTTAINGNGVSVTNAIGCAFDKVTQNVVEINNAKVYTNSFDEKNNFEVGDLTGTNYHFGISDKQFDLKSNSITLTDSQINFIGGEHTHIDGNELTVGDYTITDSTLKSHTGDINVKSTGTINFNTDTKILNNNSITISGDGTIAGSLINLGDQPTDVVDFNMDMTQDLLPSDNTIRNLGSASKQWYKSTFSTVDFGNLVVHNNTMRTTESNADLELKGSGTGNVVAEELTFGTGISSANDIVFDAGASTLTINSTTALNIPVGTTAQSPTQDRGIRFDTTSTLFEGFHSGAIPLGGVIDADLDTKIDLTSNQFTFNIAGASVGTLSATALTLDRFGSQDQVNIDGNTITVPDDATNAQAGLEANGTGKVILDTSNFTISGGELLNSESETDTVFTGTGLKVDRFIKIDAPAIKLPSGSSADQQTKANLKQGELFWNTDVAILQVWTGTEWKSATGQAETSITIEDLEAINLTYNLIIN